MTCGLYDGDLVLYPKTPFFNLELMKIATYYKSKKEIVGFNKKFSPNMYSKYFVRQDYPSRQKYSAAYTNVVYGGRAFDGEKYKPLKEEIELLRPDTSIYSSLKSLITNSNQQAFKVMSNAEHVRLSFNEKSIYPYWDKQLRSNKSNVIIFHDYHLTQIDNIYNFLNEDLKQYNSFEKNKLFIGMKFPAQINTEEDFLRWLYLPNTGDYFSLQYNGILTLDNIELFQEQRHGSSTQLQSIINPIEGYEYETFISEGIIKLFKSILDLRRYRLFFPLIFDRAFFIDSRWAEVLNIFNLFINHIGSRINQDDYFQRVVPFETLYAYLKTAIIQDVVQKQRIISKEQVQKTFQFVRENNYELFKMFYEYTGELK